MKQRHIGKLPVLLLLAAVLLMENSCMFLPEEEKNITDSDKGTLVWSDEFTNSGCPLTTKWKYQIGSGGWGNNEVQNYIDNSSSATTAYVSNGTLKIKAYKDGSTWKSARMNSRQSWKYGYIEAKMKVTNIKGFWPAFWMMPQDSIYGSWPSSGEIDIMENAPSTCGVNRVFSTLHAKGHYYDGNGGSGKSIGSKSFEDLESEYHTFAIKWNENQIIAYYDGAEQGSYNNDGNGYKNWPYDKEFYIILNLAVGGNLGGSGYNNHESAILEIDYVRVYQ